jgi:hypothetical protein
MPTKNVVAVTIAAGGSMSTSGNLTTFAATAMIIPPNWTEANASFQVSDDNITFYNLLDAHGHEFLVPAVAGGCVNMDPSLTDGALYVQVRSGSTQNPVPQVSDCTIKLICV